MPNYRVALQYGNESCHVDVEEYDPYHAIQVARVRSYYKWNGVEHWTDIEVRAVTRLEWVAVPENEWMQDDGSLTQWAE